MHWFIHTPRAYSFKWTPIRIGYVYRLRRWHLLEKSWFHSDISFIEVDGLGITTPRKMTSFGEIPIRPFRYLINWGRRTPIGYCTPTPKMTSFWKKSWIHSDISLIEVDTFGYTDSKEHIFFEKSYQHKIWETCGLDRYRHRGPIYKYVGSPKKNWQIGWSCGERKKTREERQRDIITSGGEQTQSLGVLTRRSVVYPNQIPLPDRYLSQPRQKIPGLRI